MPARIKFVFERGGELVAQLRPELAPRTTARVLALLPHVATLYHTRWCGREIYCPVQSRDLVPRENQTATANTGDVTYWREWEAAEAPGKPPPEAVSIYYGAEVIRDHRGFLLVNVFARISEDQWPVITDVGLRVWQHGVEQVRLEAVPD